ncbi:Hypothetical protein ACGLYG10_1853 [Actinomyces glycerinitolerans]|uniref:Uncharacterized protein n=1 Tax=Actinomyces glycerinitolerans TaxID=1892869 RepID=A0A1M4S0A1_9ACTO|nr:Hypothetical protein ACGLYG10_1853 [Actinomyces glycerinitolerans]
MEPGLEDREDGKPVAYRTFQELPQWSPASKTGKTTADKVDVNSLQAPQWSPALKTGKTWGQVRRRAPR